MVEMEKEYASKGVAGAGLGTGIAGLSLGVLNAMGGLGALAMGNRNQTAPVVPAAPYVWGGWNGYGGCCSDNMPVTRYDMDKEHDIAAKDAEISLLKANIYNDQKALELYAYVDGQLKDIRQSLCNQAVHNQRTEDSFALTLRPCAPSCPRISRLKLSGVAAATTPSSPTQTQHSILRWWPMSPPAPERLLRLCTTPCPSAAVAAATVTNHAWGGKNRPIS